MIRHIVLLTWTDDATPEQRAAVVAGLRELPGRIPQIRSYSVEENSGTDDGNAGLALVGEFDDLDDYATYRDHPVHQALIREKIRPILAGRAGIQVAI